MKLTFEIWYVKDNLLSTVTQRNLNLSAKAISWFVIKTEVALSSFLLEMKEHANLFTFSDRQFSLSHDSTFEELLIGYRYKVMYIFTFRVYSTTISKMYKVKDI